MCLYNYNKEKGKYKHLTYAERTMIETWYNSDHKSKKEIAELLHKSERTMRREINRGLITIRAICGKKRKNIVQEWLKINMNME